MAALLKEESTITAKDQTTVPKAVRQALGVDYGGRIAFVVDDQRRVFVETAVEDTRDPVVDRFLAFLARDMAEHPGTSIVALPPTLRDRIAASTGAMNVDLDAEIDGWTILAHPLFLDQLEKLTRAVEALKAKKPDRYESHASTKLLAALGKLVFQTIPADPTATIYRQGSTLGDGHRHWFRAKFGNGRFRLFFRYDTAAKVIIFAWVPWRQPPRPPEGWSKNASPWGCDFGRAVQHWCRNLIRTILLRHWCWKDQRRIGDHRDRHEADRFVWAEQALAPAIDLLRLDAVALGRAGHVPARGGLFDDRPLLIGTPGPTSDVLFIAIHDQPPAVLPASVPDQSAAKLVGTTPLGKAAVTGGIYGVDPQAWLTDVLERIVSEEITVDRLGELLPWIWKAAKVGASTKEAA